MPACASPGRNLPRLRGIAISQPEFDELISKLIDTREKIHNVLVSLEEAGRPVALDQTAQGRVSRIDAISQQQMAKAGRTNLNIQLTRIQAALNRHEAGDYGKCCRCGYGVGLARLGADPAAPFCLDCTEELAALRQHER